MKTITDILHKRDSFLTKLINKTKNSKNLEVIFRTAVEQNLAKHCHFANYKTSELSVTVTNTAWATRLRYAIPDIIKQLRIQPEFKEITKIRYIVASTLTSPTKPKKEKNKLSRDNEELLRKTMLDLKKKIKCSDK